MGSFLCAPIRFGRGHAGAVNCYSTDTSGFADLDEQLLQLFVASAEAALRLFSRFRAARELAQQLSEAMASRAAIEQAKGAIMAARGISADDAFTVLVKQSQQDNVKLRELAARLLAGLATGQE